MRATPICHLASLAPCFNDVPTTCHWLGVRHRAAAPFRQASKGHDDAARVSNNKAAAASVALSLMMGGAVDVAPAHAAAKAPVDSSDLLEQLYANKAAGSSTSRLAVGRHEGKYSYLVKNVLTF